MPTSSSSTGATGDQIARSFLQTIGAPDTALMRKAVIAWIRAESGTSVRAGNPWNITYGAAMEIARKGGPKPIGSWTSQSSGLKFAVYPSAIIGAQASGRLLLGAGHDWRKYDAVIAAARKNDPIGFLNALARSAWDGGRYGTKNGGTNKLLIIYRSLGGDVGSLVLGSSSGGSSSSSSSGSNTYDSPAATLGGWGDLVKFPEGHILTQADIESIVKTLHDNHFFDTIGGSDAENQTLQVLLGFVGKPWNKQTQIEMQNAFYHKANEANALGSIAGTIGDIARAVLDPGHWVRFLALLVGAGMVAYGGVVILRASGAPAPELPRLSVVPGSAQAA